MHLGASPQTIALLMPLLLQHTSAHALYPRDFLRPRAISNFLPYERTCGAALPPGVPQALPKCVSVSRAFVGPRKRTVPWPRGLRRASLSKVKHSPPALRMRARAVSVKRRAHTVSLGISQMRLSSVIVPTTQAILPSFFSMCFDSFCTDIGGLLRFVMLSRLNMTLLNLESVRL